jgi:hypothetical protein
VIYGLDADLIFLGLASHEPYFTILRENVIETHGVNPDKGGPVGPEFFHFVSLWVLRQYLERDLRPEVPVFKWNLEYAIDDFVFLCFAAGNDFLPGMPGFSIRTQAVDLILHTYRRMLNSLGAYITYNGGVDFHRFERMMAEFTRGERRGLETIVHPGEQSRKVQEFVNSITTSEEPVYVPPDSDDRPSRPSSSLRMDADLPPLEGLKMDYYQQKFHFAPDEVPEKVKAVVEEFIHGMIWTLNYYLHGCQSWNWFYPYSYSPCVSDFHGFNTDHSHYAFELSEPFPPLLQLMSVLPPQSAHCLPPVMRFLMTDPESPLIEFYPRTFRVDLNGESREFHGTVLIPFIDAKKLKAVVEGTELGLDASEMQRNTFGSPRLFVGIANAPPKQAREPIPVKGPALWGNLTRVPAEFGDDRLSCELIYALSPVSAQTELSFILPGFVDPPWAIDMLFDERRWDTHWDRGTIDIEGLEQKYDLPLQIPGVTPGAPASSRQIRVERARLARAGPPPGYPSLYPPGYPPGVPTGYPPGYLSPANAGFPVYPPPGMGYPPVHAAVGYPHQAPPGYPLSHLRPGFPPGGLPGYPPTAVPVPPHPPGYPPYPPPHRR